MASFSAHSTLGAVQIGFSVSCVVFGVLLGQAYAYFKNFPVDRRVYKVLVISLLFLECLDMVFMGHFVYYYTVTNFSHPLVILTENIIWTLILQALIGNIIGTIVKCCFATRVWTFSGRNIMVATILSLLVSLQFGWMIVYIVRSFQLGKFVLNFRLKTIATVTLATGVVTDVSIASFLCFYLKRLRTGHSQYDSVINRLSVYAISTGALTSTVNLTTLILYNAYPETFYFIATYFLLGKLYIISFLCTLHTRQTAKRRGRDGPAEGLQGGVLGSDCQWETGRLGVHVALRPSQKHRVETGVVKDVVIPTRTET